MLPFNFISIPRCASQSIHAALGTNKFNNHVAWHIAPQPHLYTFAVFREPIDRLKSWFFFHKKKYKYNEDVNRYYKGTFDEWIAKGCIQHWSHAACKSIGISTPLSQFDFIQSEDGKRLGPIRLLRFEHLNEDINSIAKFLRQESIKLRRSSPSHKPEFIVSEQSEKIIKELFPKDFKIYAALNSHMSPGEEGKGVSAAN